MTKSMAVSAAVSLALLASCSDGPITTEDMYGIWVNDDDGFHRVIECMEADESDPDLAGESPVYRVYDYDFMAAPEVLQEGWYEVQKDDWLTHPLWATDASLLGNTYSNHVYWLIGDEMMIESASAESGKRKYVRVDELP